jgi:hypothetical protein
MTDIIDFLERMGRDAGLRGATRAELAEVLVEAQVDPLVRKAVVAGDRRTLEHLLGAQPNVCCMTNYPENDGDQEEQERKAKEAEKRPDQTASAHSNFGPLAIAA